MIQCASIADVNAYLDRHQARRRQSTPTVTTLVGATVPAVNYWQRWCDRECFIVVLNTNDRLEDIITNWIIQCYSQRNLTDDIALFFIPSLASEIAQLQDCLAHQTPYERELLVQKNFRGDIKPELFVVFYALIEQIANRQYEGQSLVKKFQQLVRNNETSWEIVLEALYLIFANRCLPALLFFSDNHHSMSPVNWMNSLTPILEQLYTIAVKVPLAIVVEKQIFEKYRCSTAESRGKTIICETTLQLPRLSKVKVPDDIPIDITSSSETIDQARSAAERLLYEQLQLSPKTTGLFTLNERIDIIFGNGTKMEVDLICKKLNLVIEIDGYYHFQNQEAYRRDRRKDFLLQHHGYLILRFLADDVLIYLDNIMNTILEVIQFRLENPIQ